MSQSAQIVDSLAKSIVNVSHEIFGSSSSFNPSVVEPSIPLSEVLGWMPSWQYTVLVMFFILLVLLCFYRYGSSIRLLLSNFISVPATQVMLVAANVEFNDFLRYSRVISFMGLSIVLTGVLHHIFGIDVELFYLLMVVSGGVLFSFFIGVLMRNFIALFDYDRKRIAQIASVYSLDVLVFALFLALPIFIFLSVPIARLALLLLLGLFYFIHIVKIFYIFSQQRFSFLQTFLYLCTVEVAPFTLSWSIVTGYKVL